MQNIPNYREFPKQQTLLSQENPAQEGVRMFKDFLVECRVRGVTNEADIYEANLVIDQDPDVIALIKLIQKHIAINLLGLVGQAAYSTATIVHTGSIARGAQSWIYGELAKGSTRAIATATSGIKEDKWTNTFFSSLPFIGGLMSLEALQARYPKLIKLVGAFVFTMRSRNKIYEILDRESYTNNSALSESAKSELQNLEANYTKRHKQGSVIFSVTGKVAKTIKTIINPLRWRGAINGFFS